MWWIVAIYICAPVESACWCTHPNYRFSTEDSCKEFIQSKNYQKWVRKVECRPNEE
jgi:hypothetical protein